MTNFQCRRERPARARASTRQRQQESELARVTSRTSESARAYIEALLGQSLLAVDGELCLGLRSVCARLSSPNADAIRSRGDDSISVAVNSAQIASVHLEGHVLRLTASQVDATDATKCVDRGVRRLREVQIQLHDFFSIALSG